ncbi:MAG: hypothetical protein ACXABG_11100, partial [Promethearchaeota archaeon]
GALQEIYRLLKPEGKSIIADVDDSIGFLVDPLPEELAHILIKIQNFQAQMGGNRAISRLLPKLLKSTGFKNIQFLIIFSIPSLPSAGQDDNWFNRTIFSDDWDYQRSKIDIDSASNVIIVGTTSSNRYPLKNAFDFRTDFTFNRIFVTKFSPSGEMLWSSYLGE